MANLTEESTFHPAIYQLETSDPVLGGPAGISNLQPKQLGDRTKYLKDHVDALETAASGMASQAWVTAELEKLDHKQSVRAATTANIALNGLQTIDGVTLVAGNRVLVKNQSAGAQNGIYVVSPTSWTRAADANDSVEITAGLVCAVDEGTTQENSRWQLITDDPITMGVTALVFANVSAGYAPIASPTFTGNPAAPTPTSGDNDTSLATTGFVFNAIDGLVAVAVGGNSNVSLTASQGGAGIIELTGVLTGSIALNLPAGTGQYLISNKTTGSFNITAQMTGGPGTSVILPQNVATIIYSDGTNVKPASSAGQAFLTTQHYTPSPGTTSLAVLGGYTPGAVLVVKNGTVLKPGDDYNGSASPNITSLAASVTGDEFTVYAFTAFQIADAVRKTGDTMLGDLVLAGVPTADLMAATKKYVDDMDAFRVALTAFTGSNQSMAASGYQRFPGGLIIQWGSGTTPGGSFGTVTFPMAFPNAVYGLVTGVLSGGSTTETVEYQSLGLSSVQLAGVTAGVGGSVGYSYLAIGR